MADQEVKDWSSIVVLDWGRGRGRGKGEGGLGGVGMGWGQRLKVD